MSFIVKYENHFELNGGIMSEAIKEWWYAKGAQRCGPFCIDTLRAHAGSGELLADDLVWRQGMESWLAAASLDLLHGFIIPLPPPIPGAASSPAENPAPSTPSPPSLECVFRSENGESLDNCARAFVGKRHRHYFPCWLGMQRKNSTMSWNWGAFFFGIVWMAYRKMYLLCIQFAALIFAAWFLMILLLPPYKIVFFMQYTSVVAIAIGIFVGLHANQWYKRHVERKVRALAASNCNLEWAENEATRHGGTSLLSAVLVGMVALLLTVVFFN